MGIEEDEEEEEAFNYSDPLIRTPSARSTGVSRHYIPPGGAFGASKPCLFYPSPHRFVGFNAVTYAREHFRFE